jgi:iron complex outermembrane recepter protein
MSLRAAALVLLIGGTVPVRPWAAEPSAASETDSAVLAPITVRGEKVERSLKDTATSVGVFDRTDLERLPGVDTISDALTRAVNITLTDTTNFAPAVRGLDGTGPAQGGDAFFGGTRSRLAIFVDGRPVSYNELTFGDAGLWDAEQIEVFRGPQSTLQGRNAIAGAIVVRTRDPVYDFEAGGRLLGGNYELRQAAAYVSGPIVADQLAYRLSAERRTAHSYVDMVGYEGVDDPGEFESTGLRGKLLIEPHALPSFSTLLTLSHVDDTQPQVEYVQRPFDAHRTAFDDPDSGSIDPTFTTRPTSGIADTTWAISETLTFNNKLALTDLYIERQAPPGFGNAEIDARELFLEPRLGFTALDGRLTGFGALYLFQNEQDETIDILDGVFDDRTRTAAVFGEATLALSRVLDLIFGGRYENEHRERDGSAGPFVADFNETYREFLPKLGVAWHASEQWTVGSFIVRGYNGGGAGFTFGEPFTQYEYDPEYVWSYELYARADLAGGRVGVQANAFFSDYEDLQLPFDQNPDPAVWSVVIRNAEAARVYGAEVSARWLALPGLEVFGSAGTQKTEITRYPNEQGQSLEGNELARAPALTANAGFTWRHVSGFELSADARYSSAYYSDVRNRAEEEVGPYWLANAQTGYRFGERLRVFAYVTNLFDSDEPVILDPVDTTTPDDDAAALLRPRSYGIGIEAML